MGENFWNEILINLINALVPVFIVALPALATALVGLAVQYIRYLQAKIRNENPTQYEILEVIVDNAVMIAEQLYKTQEIQDRKQWAIEYVQKKAKESGIKIDVDFIAEEIEKAVFVNFNYLKD